MAMSHGLVVKAKDGLVVKAKDSCPRGCELKSDHAKEIIFQAQFTWIQVWKQKFNNLALLFVL